MGLITNLRRSQYVSSIDSRRQDALLSLQAKLRDYYTNRPYHKDWIAGINSRWTPGQHDAQLKLSQLLQKDSFVLEVGCGDGAALEEMRAHSSFGQYLGIDLKPDLWRGRAGFVAGDASALPIRDKAVDAVVSMYVIEHLVYPWRFLSEAWRVLKTSGRLLMTFEAHQVKGETLWGG